MFHTFLSSTSSAGLLPVAVLIMASASDIDKAEHADTIPFGVSLVVYPSLPYDEQASHFSRGI